MTVTTNEADERAALAARIRTLNVMFETTSLPALLDPLLSVELTIQQMKVMTVLLSSPDGATGRGLSEAFGVTMASMSGLLDRLVAQGMVERSGDPTDARVRRIRVTDLGRATMRSLVVARPEFDDDILLGVPAADLRALVRGMEAIQRELARRTT